VSAPARRLRLELAYDGTDFAGWQVQPGRRTVQGLLEAVLSRLQGGRAARARGAGRTDAGVHAAGQVADALLAADLDDARIGRALERMLPPDLRPLAVRTVAAEFDARRQALAKTYRYSLDLSRHGDPFARRLALHCPWPLDLGLVGEALERLPGRRDWSGFAAASCTARSRVRTLHEARLEHGPGARAALVFAADGFLHHMVRNLVGTLLAIGRRQRGLDAIELALATGRRALAGPTAPPHGLCLERVDYAPGPQALGAVERAVDPH